MSGLSMNTITINSLVYRNYLTSSLLPIFTIEILLVLLYFGINLYISEKNQAMLLNEATEEIQEIASREVKSINIELREASHLGLMMQRDHESFFANNDSCYLPNGEPEFSVHENGAFFKKSDNGGSSLYYASTTKIGQTELRKARCSEMLDPLMASIVETIPIITQAYLNTWDDMNRLYPFMPDAPAQYGSSINMEDYNFFYAADVAHNPGRKPVWTSAYLDPAGQGWMVSLVVPIYRGDFLEGVSGVDVTLGSFVQHILDLHFPWDAATFMVDRQGTILAMQQDAEKILGLHELGAHVYKENIKETIEKPIEYKLLNNSDEALKLQLKQLFDSKARIGSLTIHGTDYLVSQEIVPESGWRMFTLIEKSYVFESITQLKRLSNEIGLLAILVMVIFYILFFFYLLKKSSKVAALIASPIEKLSALTKDLGVNLKLRRLESVGIMELDVLSHNFTDMARELEIQTNSLITAKLEAESANMAKSRFLNIMSHELRTPLNAIMGMARMLSKVRQNEAKHQQYTAVILDSSNNLLNMLNDLFDYSSLETNKLQLETSAFAFDHLAHEVTEKIVPKAKERQIEFSFRISQAVPEQLIGDEMRLQRVLLYLCDNAVKFTEPGGGIEVTVDVQEETGDSVSLHVAVADTGIGLSQEQAEGLFQTIGQIDTSNTRKYQGAGLGLVLSKKLIELMDGTIWVESELGVGSTFHFVVPLWRTIDL